MRIRAGLAWIGVSGTAAALAGCGGSQFTTGGSDASAADARVGTDALGHRREAAAEDAAADARRNEESGPPADARSPRDSSRADAGKDAGRDAIVTSDSGVDAGVDGGACASKTTMNQDGNAVFMTTSGVTGVTTATGCGSRSGPCGDLASAIFVLSHNSGRNIVFIAPGTYPSPSAVALPDGVTLQGGWTVSGTTWTASCDPSDTPTLASSAPSVLTVGNAGAPSAGTVTLDTVNVQNTATPTASESLYGVMAVGSSSSSLVLRGVRVVVPGGGAGAQGASGSTGAAGIIGGCIQTGGGGTGTDGSPVRGSYGPGGYLPQSTVSNEAGIGPTGATPAPVTTCAAASDGTGTPGNGNPTLCTFVGATCTPEKLTVTCAPPANSGCGGGGGTGGYGGAGGGASIALYLWSEAAVVEAGRIAAGSGGAGGLGGTGGGGGMGGAGAPGGALSNDYYPGCHIVTLGVPPNQTMSCVLKAPTQVTAQAGNPGEIGGTGGTGAGGSGGDSYSYYLGGGATISTTGTPVFAFATVAAPGGSPSGLGGYVGQTNTSD